MKERFSVRTKYGEFQAIVEHSKRDKVYFVSAPAFPGILTEAHTIPEAKKYAREIIELQCLAAFDGGKVVIDDTNHVYGSRKLVHPGIAVVVA